MAQDQGLANLRKAIKKSKIPRRSKTDNLLLLTWNIRKFSDKKSDKAIKYIAEIIKKFDVIAIQEVMKNLEGIEKLQKLLGKNYRFIFSDAAGNNERLLFCYYKNNVKFTGLAAEIVNNPGHGREKNRNSNLDVFDVKPKKSFTVKISNLKQKKKFRKILEVFIKNKRKYKLYAKSTSKEPLKKGDIISDRKDKIKLHVKKIEAKKFGDEDPKNGYYATLELDYDEKVKIVTRDFVLEFDRTPYLASFQKNNCHFIVTTVHIYYGTPDQVEFRRDEIDLLAKYIDKETGSADVLDPDYIVCGDFNIEEAVEYELKKNSKKTDTEIRKSLFSTLTRNNLIIPEEIQKIPTNLEKNMYYDQIGYQQFKANKKKGITASTIKFRKANSIDFKNALEDHFDNLKHDFTDHLPLWAEFGIEPDQNSIQINT